MNLYSHQMQFGVRSLGPGCRVVYWVSGCTIGCPNCCSPETHDRSAGVLLSVAQIMDAITAYSDVGGLVEGLSISGGEPSEQSASVIMLIQAFRTAFPNADVLLYSGLPWRVIVRDFSDFIEMCDVIIAEPFVHTMSDSTKRHVLAGSANQSIHLLSPRALERYPAYFARPPTIQIQQVVDDGAKATIRENTFIRFTGVPNATFLGTRHD